MKTIQRDTHYAMMLELVLEKKIHSCFDTDAHTVTLYQVITSKKGKRFQQLQAIEMLIPMIRENIAVGQFKRALKLLATMDHLMKQVLQNK